eukprot:6208144-Pleurochrysis_carterae.AAC.1
MGHIVVTFCAHARLGENMKKMSARSKTMWAAYAQSCETALRAASVHAKSRKWYAKFTTRRHCPVGFPSSFLSLLSRIHPQSLSCKLRARTHTHKHTRAHTQPDHLNISTAAVGFLFSFFRNHPPASSTSPYALRNFLPDSTATPWQYQSLCSRLPRSDDVHSLGPSLPSSPLACVHLSSPKIRVFSLSPCFIGSFASRIDLHALSANEFALTNPQDSQALLLGRWCASAQNQQSCMELDLSSVERKPLSSSESATVDAGLVKLSLLRDGTPWIGGAGAGGAEGGGGGGGEGGGGGAAVGSLSSADLGLCGAGGWFGGRAELSRLLAGGAAIATAHLREQQVLPHTRSRSLLPLAHARALARVNLEAAPAADTRTHARTGTRTC